VTGAPAASGLRSWGVLALLVIGCVLVGAAGGAVTRPSIPVWYATLEKPSFTPPNWAFPVVWTALFVLMGVAAWRVWRLRGFRAAPFAFGLFFTQLAFNFGWSVLFFALQMPPAALAWIGALWLLIVATMVSFWRNDRVAGLLLVPYLVWVTYATVLNAAIVRLNEG
jgi:translocator protein